MAEKGKTPYYFPSKESEVVPWAKNFQVALVANAARWGVADALVTALGVLVTAFEEAFNRRMLPDAGRVSVEQKNLALKALKKGLQEMINGHINNNAAVTPDDRILLGLHVYKSGRSPIGEPTTTVILRILTGLVRQIVVHFADSDTPDSRAKPYGVRGMELAYGVQSAPPASIEDLHRTEYATKSPLTLTFREEDRGKTVYMAGRWRNSSLKGGPWSAIVSAVIP